MTKYREIIRFTGLGFSQRNIMASCGVAQKTVVKVQKRARELNLSWPLDESMTDTELQRLMFAKESLVSKNKCMPDYDYIHKELLRNGVSKKLLWTEYMEDCRANGKSILFAPGTDRHSTVLALRNDLFPLFQTQMSFNLSNFIHENLRFEFFERAFNT